MNRLAFDVLLSALRMTNQDFADLIGCDRSYFSQIKCGTQRAGDRLRAEIGQAIAMLLLDEDRSEIRERIQGQRLLDQHPTLFRWAPLRLKVERRAIRVGCTPRELLQKWGVDSPRRRYYVDTETVETICDKLSIHPTEVYPEYYELAAS